MRVTQTELGLINGRTHRRMMRLPLERGELGELKKCPVKAGRSYRLSSTDSAVTVTIMDVYREKLAAISPADARREGFAGVQGALMAWEKQHGTPVDGQVVWVVSFELGDRSQSFDRPVLLARHGDYTTEPSQAVRGEGEVLMPLAKDLARARAKAMERRVNPQREALAKMRGEAASLLQSMTAMKDRNRLKLIVKEYDKLLVSTSAGEGDTLSASVCATRQVPVDVEGEPRPCSTNSEASSQA